MPAELRRFRDWRLRAKMATLLGVASLLPLGLATYLGIRAERQRLVATTRALLAARGDQLADQLDSFHRTYLRTADTFARVQLVRDVCRADASGAARLEPQLQQVLRARLAADPDLRGIGLLDGTGRVRLSTDAPLVGMDLSFRSYVRSALGGAAVVSDLHVAEAAVGRPPTVAYVVPMQAPEAGPVCLVVLWVRAAALWSLARASNERAGPGSFAVLFDEVGIRIAHTSSDDILFHPGGPLQPAEIESLVAEQRFGEQTRGLLNSVRPFPQQFERARARSPDSGMFYGYAPVNRKWTYGVGRRLLTTPWTVFFMIPEDTLLAETAAMTRERMLFAAAIIAVALLTGSRFGAVILGPLKGLSKATEALAQGDLTARVETNRDDELGQLSRRFNAMAERLQAQSQALQQARDQLERRVEERTAELLRATRELATTLDSIGDAVIATDAEGRIVRMNPVAEELTGWSGEDARGRPLREVARLVGEGGQLLEGPSSLLGLPAHGSLLARDGTPHPVAASASPIRDRPGAASGAVLVLRDESQARRVEALRAESERLQEASRLKSEFLANMSHELRTPLNAIIGFAEMLHDGKLGPMAPEHRELLADILTSAWHLLQIINDVLDLAKVEAGKMELRPEPVELGAVVTEVRDMLRKLALDKRIAVATDIAPGLDGLRLDPGKLKQILYNFLSNALKFTPEGGRVALRAAPEGAQSLRIEVEDSGIGISPQDVARLFVEFQQLDGGLSKKFQGTGLGLALTRRIAEAHGGHVGVRSTPGQGSVFFVVLPRRLKRAAAPAQPEAGHA